MAPKKKAKATKAPPAAVKKAPAKKKASATKSARPAKKPQAAKAPVAVNARPAPVVGAMAPDFELQADDGSIVSLASLRGKHVVLYFYPKDSTPGCTVEACGFRDAFGRFARKDAVILGVSRDSIGSHERFRAKQTLPFRLLSDPSAEVIGAYGSWGPKVFMGRKFDGILRTTVLIDPEGRIKKVYAKVTPKTHAEEVLADL